MNKVVISRSIDNGFVTPKIALMALCRKRYSLLSTILAQKPDIANHWYNGDELPLTLSENFPAKIMAITLLGVAIAKEDRRAKDILLRYGDSNHYVVLYGKKDNLVSTASSSELTPYISNN